MIVPREKYQNMARSLFLLLLFCQFFGISAHSSDLSSYRSGSCSQLFENALFKTSQSVIFSSQDELVKFASEIAARRTRVPEFQFIREEAAQRGLRIWLFGGTAASYAHYVKWDLLREHGDNQLQSHRFDYDYTNIYRSTQDLDLVVSGNAKQAQLFEQILKQRFPYFLGSKEANWEVRSLHEAREDKGGLLGDFGFMNQHTDSNSTGMVEITDPPAGESVVRDLRDWENILNPAFLSDVQDGQLTFYYSKNHMETPRFKAGKNPPIFSVIRALIKSFQYDLKIGSQDLAILQEEVRQFDPSKDLQNPEAASWIEKNGKKLFQHAVNLEYAWNMLERIGLRKKLISIRDDAHRAYSLAWWMNKEPLRTKNVGQGTRRTAESLKIQIVSHETGDYLAYESITRSHTGAPNVFISRENAESEAAGYGNGFYTTVGRYGSKASGITIRFEVNPNAREGSDFIIAYGEKNGTVGDGAYIIWFNKDALRIIPESIEFTFSDYFRFLAQGKSIGQGLNLGQKDEALICKVRRKIFSALSSGWIPLKELEQIRLFLLTQIKHQSPYRDTLIQEWYRVESARLKGHKDLGQIQAMSEILRTRTFSADPAWFFLMFTELSRGTDLEYYLTKEWFPAILKTFKTDIGNRALENILFSNSSAIQENLELQEFGARALADREAKNPSAFVNALKRIQSWNGDAWAWIKSEAQTEEEIKEKASYLALHLELIQKLSGDEYRVIEPFLEKISNFSVFKKIAGGDLAVDAKSESFQFKVYDFPSEGKRVKLGSPGEEREIYEIYYKENQHEVTFTKSFEIQVTPVTQLQWTLLMGDNPSEFKSYNTRNNPVEQVSWTRIQKFIEKLNQMDPYYLYRLPTEAEWEYAGRAGTDTPYSFGDDPHELSAYGWYSQNSFEKTHEVATLKPNPDGLYDVHGNVWEWVEDQWEDTRPYSSINPTGPGMLGSYPRVIRGSSWLGSAHSLRSARRKYYKAGDRDQDIGFRLVRTRK